MKSRRMIMSEKIFVDYNINMLIAVSCMILEKTYLVQAKAQLGNFSISYNKLNHSEATKKCQFSCPSSRLADIENTEEENRYLRHFNCKGFEESWFGLEKRNGKWVWSDGRDGWILRNTGYSWQHWDFIEPDGTGPCVRIGNGDGEGRDMRCDIEFGYICEGDFPDPCQPNPCENGGTCCVIDFDYYCLCTNGHSGPLCQNSYGVISSVSCSSPPDISNTDKVYDPGSYEEGTVVAYSCKHGYQHEGGQLMRKCTTSGVWSGCNAICEIKNCTEPTTPNNIKVMTSHPNYSFQSVITYQCAQDYELLSGDLVRMCQDNQEWSGTEPNCKEIVPQNLCTSPPVIDNADIIYDPKSYPLNAVVVYQCKQYAKNQGGNQVRNCTSYGSSGYWYGSNIICEKIVCTPPAQSIGRVSLYNDTHLTETCENGYYLHSGDRDRVCSANGVWSGTQVICEAISCQNPGNIPHSAYTQIGISFTFQSVLNFTCDKGYQHTSGNLILVCLSNTEWSGQFPLCKEIQCPEPEDNDGMYSSYNSTTYTSLLIQSCKPGYSQQSGIHNNTRTCLQNGTWSGEQIICRVKRCTDPPNIAHAFATVKKDSDTEIASYKCKYGFTLATNSTTKICLSNLTWYGEDPVCVDSPLSSVINVPADPEPSTMKENIMESMGMLEADLLPFNLSLGSVLGCVYLTIIIGLILCLDFVSLQRDLKILKRNFYRL